VAKGASDGAKAAGTEVAAIGAAVGEGGREGLAQLGALAKDIDPAVMSNLYSLAADVKGLQGPFNIFFSYIQVLSFLQVTFDVDWPPIFTSVMDWLGSLVHIDPLKFIKKVSFCKMGADFGDKLLMSMLILPMFALCIIVVYFCLKCLHHFACCKACKHDSQHARHEKHLAGWDHRSALNAAVRLGNMITFLLYPTLCNTIFRTFKCEPVGPRAYLRETLSVECSLDDPRWNWMVTTASIGVVVYVIGVPAIYFLVLYKRRKLLVSPSEAIETEEKGKQRISSVAHFKIRQRWSQLFIQYESKYWYFERRAPDDCRSLHLLRLRRRVRQCGAVRRPPRR
jgi:hypothetical protein